MHPYRTWILQSLLLPVTLVATAEVTAQDACATAALGGAAEAERVCSDRIAELRYMGDTAPDSRAMAGALNNRALARMAGRDLEGAAADLGEAMTLSPNAWALYLNRGNLFLRQRDPGAALNDYGRVAELAPEQSDAALAALRNSALAWRALGNLAAAERAIAGAGIQGTAGSSAADTGFSRALQPPADPGHSQQ
jgi:tetratricopeptide (TPR) repeat protein